eukprot:414894_1
MDLSKRWIDPDDVRSTSIQLSDYSDPDDVSAIQYIQSPSYQYSHMTDDYSTLWQSISFILSFTILGSITSEILLLSQIYADPLYIAFFVLSCAFLIIPLCIVSCFVCILSLGSNELELRITKTLKWLLLIPFINTQLIWSHSKLYSKQYGTKYLLFLSLFETFLTGTMIYPLYVVNIAFCLTAYDQISIYNKLQILLTFVNFIFNPIKLLFYVTKYSNYNARKPCATGDAFKIYMSSSFVYTPIVILEAIHLTPFGFCYYVFHTLNTRDWIIILLLFSVPKFTMICHMMHKIMCRKKEENDDADFGCVLLPIFIFLLPTVPLVPYFAFMYSKHTNDTNLVWLWKDNGCCGDVTFHYWHMVMYIAISYGISTVYTISCIGFHEMSSLTKIAMVAIIMLSLFIVLTFPLGFAFMKRSGVRFGY